VIFDSQSSGARRCININASQLSWRADQLRGTHHRNKASFDIFWLRDESLEESDNLPDPDIFAQEIVEDSKPRSNNSVKPPRI
jgi:hypothetical protein